MNFKYLFEHLTSVVILLTAIFGALYYFFTLIPKTIHGYYHGLKSANKAMVLQIIITYFMSLTTGFIIKYYKFTPPLIINNWLSFMFIFLIYAIFQLSFLLFFTIESMKVYKKFNSNELAINKKSGNKYFNLMLIYSPISGFINSLFMSEISFKIQEANSNLLAALELFSLISFILLPVLTSGFLFSIYAFHDLNKHRIFFTEDLKGHYPGLDKNKSLTGYIVKQDDKYIWIKTAKAPMFSISNQYIEGILEIKE